MPDVSRRKPADPDAPELATRNHDVIWKWARARDADPATGEASESGPASALKVVDGGSGLRFNFPSLSRFRTIKWSEWFEHFDRHELMFVYDKDDPARRPSTRYRLIKAKDWDACL